MSQCFRTRTTAVTALGEPTGRQTGPFPQTGHHRERLDCPATAAPGPGRTASSPPHPDTARFRTGGQASCKGVQFSQTRQELEGCADQPVRGSEDLRLRRVRRPRGHRGVLPGRPSGPLQRKRLTAAGRGGEGQEAQRPLIGDRGPGAACAQTMCSGGSREGRGIARELAEVRTPLNEAEGRGEVKA